MADIESTDPAGQPDEKIEPTEAKTAADLPTDAAPPAGKRGKGREPRAPFENLDAYLAALYDISRRTPGLKPAEVGAIKGAWEIASEVHAELLERARNDRLLDRTRALLLLAMDRFEGTPAGASMRDFARQVLIAHPAFATSGLTGLLKGTEDGLNEEEALRILGNRPFEQLRWPEGVPPLTKKQATHCRINAIGCLLLWFRAKRPLALDGLLRHLQSSMWLPTARRQASERQSVKTLLIAKDIPAMSLVAQLFQARLSAMEQEILALKGSIARATERAEKAEGTLQGCKADLEASRSHARALEESLNAEKKQHLIDNTHSRDRLETLRGRILQRLRAEVSLLDEGLTALRRDPPKVHVMVDHADRVLDGLKSEMERLRGDD